MRCVLQLLLFYLLETSAAYLEGMEKERGGGTESLTLNSTEGTIHAGISGCAHIATSHEEFVLADLCTFSNLLAFDRGRKSVLLRNSVYNTCSCLGKRKACGISNTYCTFLYLYLAPLLLSQFFSKEISGNNPSFWFVVGGQVRKWLYHTWNENRATSWSAVEVTAQRRGKGRRRGIGCMSPRVLPLKPM